MGNLEPTTTLADLRATQARSSTGDMAGRFFQRCFRVTSMSVWLFAVLHVAITASTPVFSGERRSVRSLLEMRHEYVVVQKWDLSCGAAALATLLNHQHQDLVSEREIAKALIKRKEYIDNPALVQMRQGFSLLDLKRYVDQRGYEGVGYGRLAVQDLIKQAPIMVPVNFHGYNHFVVFRGVGGDRVLLADPAWGNRTLRLKKFEKAWIEYPKFGKVGFVIARQDGSSHTENRLAPTAEDFVMLR